MVRRFGVGAPTVREAVKKLEALGVVDVRHGSGVPVASRHTGTTYRGSHAMHVAIPHRPPTNVYMYTLEPTRPAMLVEGATDEEKLLAARHWAYSQELLSKGKVIFAGRTMVTTPDSFAICVVRADSEDEARAMMESDPAVRGGVFRARLFPYQPMLMGDWVGEEAQPAATL